MSEALVSVSVVVPVFNAATSVPELVDRIAASLDGRMEYEVILVNDASADESWEVIQALATDRAHVRGISFARNFGQHAALLAGMRLARHDVIITMDDDLQHPPEAIPVLLAELDRGYDVVYGWQADDVHGVLRSFASRLTKIALRQFMAAETARRVSAFRAFRASIRDAFVEYNLPMVNIDVLLTWGTSRFTYVEVPHARRKYGSSNYTLGLLVTHALNMITGYSVRPLQLASLMGFAFMFAGAGVLVYVLVNFVVRGGQVPGFTFIASAIAVFSGIQLFALGIIGEYLARMHMRTSGRRAYVVSRSTDPAVPRREDDHL